MTCNETNSSRVMTIITEFEDSRMNLRILVLKTKKLTGFLRRGSTLLFMFGRGILCIFHVEYNEHLARIKLERYLGFSFSETL